MATQSTPLRNVFSADSNPILRSEYRHQQYVIQNSRSGRIWIALAVMLVAPALITSLIYTGVVLIKPSPSIDFYGLPSTIHGNMGGLLIIANLSLYPVVTLVTSALARHSITREKQGATWSILQLTDIHERDILLGKWWASLRALIGDHIMVMILRVGIAAYYIGFILPVIHTTFDNVVEPYTRYFIILLPILILHAIGDAMLTVSLGILGAIPDEATGVIITAVAYLLRLIFSILVILWFIKIMATLRYSLGGAILWGSLGLMVTGISAAGTLYLASIFLK